MADRYETTRILLERAIQGMEQARRAAGRVNLPPKATPEVVTEQVAHVEALLLSSAADVISAKAAATGYGLPRASEISSATKSR